MIEVQAIGLAHWGILPFRRGSSVVERIIGNDEAESSILSRGTSLHLSNFLALSRIWAILTDPLRFPVTALIQTRKVAHVIHG